MKAKVSLLSIVLLLLLAGIGLFKFRGGIAASVSRGPIAVSQVHPKTGTQESVAVSKSRTRLNSLLEAQARFREDASSPKRQIREQLQGLVMRAIPKLALSDEELDRFADAIADVMYVNGVIKAENAKVNKLADGSIEITISPRPDDAELLWTSLQERLTQHISREAVVQIDESLGELLMQWFGGYGAANEIYRLRRSNASPGMIDYEFSAQLPQDMPKTDVSVIAKRFRAMSESGTTSFAQLVEHPEMHFLSGLLEGKFP